MSVQRGRFSARVAQSAEECREVVAQLRKQPMSVELLAATKVGVALKAFKKHTDAAVASLV